MQKLKVLVCSTIKALHDLSLDRCKSGQFLSLIRKIIIVRKDFMIEIILNILGYNTINRKKKLLWQNKV